MKYLLLLLLPFLLFGSKILSYNVYERSNRVDVMLTFDTPFEGRLSQIKKNNKIILKLEGASIEAPKIKNINTSYLHKMTLTPIASHTEVILQTASNIHMSASKTSDSYGLRLRFTKALASSKTGQTKTSSFLNKVGLETKNESEFNNSYYVVIAILVLGILIMLWLKKKMGPTSSKGKQAWLFKNTPKKEGISVRFQKPLDPKNRVAMLDYEGQSYLVLLGTSNVLLDKYSQGKPVRTQNEFDKILDDNKAELDSYLQLDNSADIEPLQSYKEKASAQAYELN
ncbi:MAG: hypothetical protein COA44_04825 [Arcobacter sp.]|nr:MAG: hypothetical protein COA44_04825 [Arcobacter sp.]